ncbi:MAG: hypothetical protein ACI9S8_002515 [Chlamydiales bacterium]|jgi:hypothetical protein
MRSPSIDSGDSSSELHHFSGIDKTGKDVLRNDLGGIVGRTCALEILSPKGNHLGTPKAITRNISDLYQGINTEKSRLPEVTQTKHDPMSDSQTTGPLSPTNENIIQDFVSFLNEEIMVGGDDSFSLIAGLYEKVQGSIPTYSHLDLEKLLEMHKLKQYNDPDLKDQYRSLREKIYNESL